MEYCIKVKYLSDQDPNAPPSYLPHAANQPLHYNPLPPNTTYGSLVATPNYATNPANGADNDDYNWTMSCVTILLCFFCGGWLSLPLSCMAVRISVSVRLVMYTCAISDCDCISEFTCVYSLPLELRRPKRLQDEVMQRWLSESQCMHSC